MMQADLQGQATVDRFRANASIGYAQKGALPAAITRGQSNNLVSRVHWLGVDLGEDKPLTVRAGRMNLPFGLRSIEHTMWIRSTTRTDINAAQQEGVSLAWNTAGWRGEVMAIAGNFQINPDEFRERGYSGYVEWDPTTKVAVGASSLITHANNDPRLQTALFRHAHGLFGRFSPVKPLVLMAEGDVLLFSQPPAGKNGAINALGYASALQADLEPVQGLHVMATGEIMNQAADSGVSFGGWATIAWFFAPHADLRADAIRQSLPAGPSRMGITSLIAQLHVFL